MESTVDVFMDAFKRAQSALGLMHFRTSFEVDESIEDYAQIHRDSVECTALVRFNPVLMERDGVATSTAIHEVAHLLVSDLRWACTSAPEHVADAEDERIASRLEPILLRAIFPNKARQQNDSGRRGAEGSGRLD